MIVIDSPLQISETKREILLPILPLIPSEVFHYPRAAAGLKRVTVARRRLVR
jgi:hypothetical protein